MNICELVKKLCSRFRKNTVKPKYIYTRKEKRELKKMSKAALKALRAISPDD